MIHCAEAVLPGHPDQFCDRVADAIVTRKPLARSPAQILVQASLAIGLDAVNHIDATR
jgi:S-adenosylmethionine synthetase